MLETSSNKNPSAATEALPLSYGATRAALASGTTQIITRVLTIVLSIATARAMEPREVGILALAVIVMALISMIGYYPETAVIVSRAEGTDERYAAATVVIRGTVVALLLVSLVALYPLMAARLTGKEGGLAELRELLVVLAWMPLLETIGSYPRVILQRRLDLNCISAAGLLQALLFVASAVFLLSKGFGYVGVAWASVLGTAAATLFLWYRLWKRGWANWEGWPAKSAWRRILLGSAGMFAGGFGGFLGERLDNLLVSGAIGPTAMSFYSMAWNGSRTPANVFGGAIGFVLVPTLARIQDEPARVQRAIRESLRHSYLLLAPACAALFVSAPLLVGYVLGAKWLPLVPCLRIMCVTVLVIPFLHACNALLAATERAHLVGIATSVHLLALVVTIPLFAQRWNILGAAFGDLVSTAILAVTLCATTRIATRQLDFKFVRFLILPVSAALFAGALGWSVRAFAAAPPLRLLTEIGLVAVGYVLFLFLLGGRSRVYDLLSVLRGATRRATVAA